jgi:hypothetical protein
MKLPIDTTNLTFLAASEPEPMTERETGRPRTDRDGQVICIIRLVALGDGEAEVLPVRIAGNLPKGIAQGTAVRCAGFSATPWTMGDRSGLTYRAERIETATAAARQAS